MRPLPSSFLPRLLSTVLLWTAVVAVYVLRSETGFAIMISIPALISLWEYFALLKSGGISHHRGMGMTAAVILIALNFLLLRSTNGLFQWSVFPCEYAVMAFFVMALFLREYGRNNPGRATGRRSPSRSSASSTSRGSSSSWRSCSTSRRMTRRDT